MRFNKTATAYDDLYFVCQDNDCTQPPASSLYDCSLFRKEAHENAMHMAQFSTEELTRLLRINNKLAAENVLRYHDFLSPDAPSLPALLAYTGIVFKRLNPKDFTEEDWKYAQQHLFITSFLYGLLRPLDLIKNYRLEGDVRMPEHGDITMFEYWRPLLTEYFITEIKNREIS